MVVAGPLDETVVNGKVPSAIDQRKHGLRILPPQDPEENADGNLALAGVLHLLDQSEENDHHLLDLLACPLCHA